MVAGTSPTPPARARAASPMTNAGQKAVAERQRPKKMSLKGTMTT